MAKNTKLSYKNIAAKHIFAFLVFVILSIFITFPLIFHMDTYITGLGDDFYPAFAQNWVIHSLSTDPANLFNANNFYPQKFTLTYSDPFITSALISEIPTKLTGEPLVSVNFDLIFSIALLGFGVFVLSFYLTENFLVSILSGILVIFAPAILDKRVHLELLSVGFFPISIAFFINFLKNYQTKFLAFSLIFLVLQTFDSILPGYFIVFFFIFALIFKFSREPRFYKKIADRKNFFVLIIALIPLIFLGSIYAKSASIYHINRDIRESIHLAIQPEDLLYPSDTTKLQNILLSLPFNKSNSPTMEVKPGFLGVIFTILLVFSIFYFFNRKDKKDYFNLFFFSSLFGLILSFGPFLHIARHTIHKPFPIPLPYAIFYYLIPGFKGMRDSERWEIFFIILLAPAIAIILSHFYNKTKNKIGFTFLLLILIAGIIGEYKFPMHFEKIPNKNNFPSVYSWLNQTPKNSSVIILPIYFWNMKGSEIEYQREFFMTANSRKMVNGYAGFNTIDWQNFVVSMNKDFPDKKLINTLKNWGVNYVILDTRNYQKMGEKIPDLKKNPDFKLIKTLPGFYVFEVK